MSSTTAIRSPTVSSTRHSTDINAFADQVTTETACSALKSTPIALTKTFAMFTPIVSTTQLCESARACVMMDMKVLAEFAIWLLNASHRQIADTIRSVTKEFASATADMNVTILTCKLRAFES
jgi:hypothetical protein